MCPDDLQEMSAEVTSDYPSPVALQIERIKEGGWTTKLFPQSPLFVALLRPPHTLASHTMVKSGPNQPIIIRNAAHRNVYATVPRVQKDDCIFGAELALDSTNFVRFQSQPPRSFLLLTTHRDL